MGITLHTSLSCVPTEPTKRSDRPPRPPTRRALHEVCCAVSGDTGRETGVFCDQHDRFISARHVLPTRRGGSLVPQWRSIAVNRDAPRNASPLPFPSGAPRGSLGAIIGNFKSITARRINQIRKMPGMPAWQRNYYEHIVRTERALNAIRKYIIDNPARWLLDKYNPQAGGPDSLAAELWRLLKEEAS